MYKVRSICIVNFVCVLCFDALREIGQYENIVTLFDVGHSTMLYILLCACTCKAQYVYIYRRSLFWIHPIEMVRLNIGQMDKNCNMKYETVIAFQYYDTINNRDIFLLRTKCVLYVPIYNNNAPPLLIQ